jgi:hypothetical protein
LPPEVLAQNTSARKQTSTNGDTIFLAIQPSGLEPAGALEKFNAENLSDKIDGKADLYLDAGFVSMQCQRFSLGGKSEASFEAFVYDMGTPRNAFAVFSAQRRENAKKVALGDFAYRTSDALFFAHGQYYVEVLTGTKDADAVEAAMEFARGFVNKTATTHETIRELALFPVEHLREDSIVLLAKDAFGFARFDNVFTAVYDIDGKEVTAFLTIRNGAGEANELAHSYHDFLLQNGGTAVISGSSTERTINLMDAFEVISVRGNVVLGVHAAGSKEAALRLVAALRKHDAEATR